MLSTYGNWNIRWSYKIYDNQTTRTLIMRRNTKILLTPLHGISKIFLVSIQEISKAWTFYLNERRKPSPTGHIISRNAQAEADIKRFTWAN